MVKLGFQVINFPSSVIYFINNLTILISYSCSLSKKDVLSMRSARTDDTAVLTGRPLLKIIILKVKHFMLKQNPVLPYSVSESEEDI